MSYCNVPFPAPATQSHAPTLPGTSIDCACHQMSHWCCACHTTSHCNVPFPAPATQSHAPTLPGCFNHLPPNVALVLRLPHNVTLQRTCNVFPAPATQTHTPTLPGCFNRLRLPPNVTLVLRHSVTMQRTLPCTSHPEPRSNATRMLQSPATKCHTGAAPATQRHTATYMQRTIPLHQPPRATLQRYQDASIDCACHQMSHWCCACHTTSQFNVPFPAPATQIHAATGSVTCTSEPISRVQASQFHVYKRTRAPTNLPPDDDDDIVTSLGGHHFQNPWAAQTTMAARDGRDATATQSGRSWLLEKKLWPYPAGSP